VKKKLIADAAVVLGKIEAAQSAEALAAAIKEAKPFSSVASIQQAIPAATQRLATLKAQADKATTRDFLSRVEEAERRDMKHPSAKNKAEEQLKRYFEEFFQEGGRRRGAEKTWDFEEFKEAMDIIAPSIRGKDLKAAFALADEDGSGSIDAQEFMSRAGQYQSLSEKIGEGHTCRRGSLTSVSVPTAAALKSDQRPAAPQLKVQHSRGSSTATPGSTPPRGSGSAPVLRSAATGGDVPRAVSLEKTVKRESIVAGFTDADKQQAARLFSEYDDDGSGELDFDEFREVMREIAGKSLSDAQLQEAFAAVDTDGNGMVSWDEFLEGQQELRKWKQKKKPKSRRNRSPQPLRAGDKLASTL